MAVGVDTIVGVDSIELTDIIVVDPIDEDEERERRARGEAPTLAARIVWPLPKPVAEPIRRHSTGAVPNNPGWRKGAGLEVQRRWETALTDTENSEEEDAKKVEGTTEAVTSALMYTSLASGRNAPSGEMMLGSHSKYKVTVDRSGEANTASALGLNIDYIDGKSLRVTKVTGGHIEIWNNTHADCQVKRGDRIVEVNGIGGDATAMIAELTSFKLLEITFIKAPWAPTPSIRVQPIEFEICIAKGDGDKAKLGLDVDHADGVSLRIMKLREGLIADWNATTPEKQVKIGDRIVEVNNVRGSSQRIMLKIQESSEMKMSIQR